MGCLRCSQFPRQTWELVDFHCSRIYGQNAILTSPLLGIGVDQPAWKELTSVAEAEAFADEVSYPVLVRPSYVLSGAAMTVIYSKEDLKEKLEAASNVSPDHPVVM